MKLHNTPIHYARLRLHIFVPVLVMLTFILLPSVVAHAADRPCNFLPSDLCGSGDLNILIGTIANYLVGLFGSIFLLMMVVAGVQMASAADSPERIKAAKTRLTNAVVGLLLLISMRAIMALLGISIT